MNNHATDRTPEILAQQIALDIEVALKSEEDAGNLVITTNLISNLSARIANYILEGYCGNDFSAEELWEIGMYLSLFDYEHALKLPMGPVEYGLGGELAITQLIQRINDRRGVSDAFDHSNNGSYSPLVKEQQPSKVVERLQYSASLVDSNYAYRLSGNSLQATQLFPDGNIDQGNWRIVNFDNLRDPSDRSYLALIAASLKQQASLKNVASFHIPRDYGPSD